MNRGDHVLGVHFLLSLIDPDDAAAVRRRIRIGEPGEMADSVVASSLHSLRAPRSVLLWMLEENDPRTNAFVFHHMYFMWADELSIIRDVVRGVPFGSATGRLRVVCGKVRCAHQEPAMEKGPHRMLDGLRLARSMGAARTAARAVSRRDWPRVAEADRAEPLPGYSRWALSIRLDCPPGLRAQFGSHPKFTNRLRRAGIVELGEYVEGPTPARFLLGVLSLGARLFPSRVRQATTGLAPLVRDELGTNPEAWAVLAQLLPTFTGSARELLRTCGAVAHV